MDNLKPKILFVLPSLRPGGAERVISFVSQNLNSDIFEITLLIISNKTEDSYVIGDHVQTIFLNKSRVLKSIPSLFKGISELKPDIVVSCISHLNVVMAILSLFFPKSKFIAREATVSGKRKNSKSIRSKLFTSLSRFAYPKFDKIICQSTDMKIDLLENYDIPEDKVTVINNPITNSQDANSTKATINYNNVIKYITVGRLVNIKGYLRLLQVLSKITFDYNYTIIGDGPMKDEIFEAIKDYGMSEKVIHIPYTTSVSQYLIESDFFLQGSYIEGFPNAALESCTVGTPVIAFNAPGGTKEIIINGINGYMVEDENEFLEKLCENRQWDINQIKNLVNQKFGKKTIINQYTDLFLTI
tara:strand:- start:21869 stop:22942 length:1074 start_codon:yes stop_codon:yes gene_type:complete